MIYSAPSSAGAFDLAPGNPVVERLLVDPDAFGRFGYPWGLWRQMRRESPLYRCVGHFSEPFWAVTRHADVQRVTRDCTLFTNGPAPLVRWQRHEQARAKVRSQVVLAPDLLELDGAQHRDQRLALLREFAPRMTAFVQNGGLQGVVDRVFAALGVRATIEFDAAATIGALVPVEVMCHLLDLPLEDRDLLVSLATEWAAPTDAPEGSQSDPDGALRRSTEGLADYFARLVRPGAGVKPSSLLTALTDNHAHLFRDQQALVTMMILVLVSGFETTKHALAGGLCALAEHPQQLAALRGSPELLDSAVEEVLRWTTPLIHFARTATDDVVMHGQKISKGDRVVLFYPSANRDDEVFEHSDQFDICRKDNAHLGFGGGGVHHCLGAPLARAEIAAVLKKASTVFQELAVVSRAAPIASNFVGGPRTVMLRGVSCEGALHA